MIRNRLFAAPAACVLCLLVACGGGGVDGPSVAGPAKLVAWVEGAMTQPVPFWGSPVRLALPVPVAAIILGPGGGLGAFGGHQGGHTEGLNHVWIPTAPGTTVRSWADGTVTKIEAMGPRSPGSAVHEYFITIDYGQGLAGKHLDWSLPGSKRQVEGSWSAPDGPGTLIVTLRARRRIWVRTRWRSDSCRR